MGNGYPHSTIAQILEDIISQLSFEGESHSNIADILLSILNQTSYDKEPYSVLAELFLKLKAKIEGVPFDPYDKETHSVIADILISILNETEYTDVPQSRIAELLLELKEELESYTEITVSGSIVSFTTNVSKPLVKLKADVEAQQDLHGYDKPWAGGGGKNKLALTVNNIKANNGGASTWNNNSKTINGVTFTIQTNDVGAVVGILATGTASATTTLFIAETELTSGIGYIVNGCPANGGGSTYEVMLMIGGIGTGALIHNYGTEQSYTETTTTSRGLQVVVRNGYAIPTGGLLFKPMIRLASIVDSSFEPYSNICPITGWSGANVTRTGSKNILNDVNPTVLNAYINGANILVSNANNRTVLIPIKPFTDYTYTWNRVSIASSDNSGVLLFETEPILGTTVGTFVGSYITSSGGHVSFNSGANRYCAIKMANINNTNFEATLSASQLEFGLSATSFAPYNGNTYTIAFGDTYYGCELDVTNGVLRVTHQKTKIKDLSWTYQSNYLRFFSASIKNTVLPATSGWDIPDGLMCECYEPHTFNSTDNGHIYIDTIGNMFIKDTAYTDATAWISTRGEYLIRFPLATPFTIQLSPQQIAQLLGDNNVFADCGDVEVTYLYKGTPEA